MVAQDHLRSFSGGLKTRFLSSVVMLDEPRKSLNPIVRRDETVPMITRSVPLITGTTVWNWVRRSTALIGVLAVVGAVGGFTASKLMKERYIASAEILVDPTNLQVVSDDLFSRGYTTDQLLEVESKLRVLTSGNVLRRVVTAMNLTDDAEFAIPSTSPATSDATTNAVRVLAERVNAQRQGRSYIVTLSVWAEDPEKSAVLANAIVTSFQAELAGAESESATRAADGLTTRLDELKSDVVAAENAVEAYKREHGLESTAGALVTEQSLTQLNQQIIEAQQRLLAAESRYRELTASGLDSMASSPAVQSTAIAALRAEYATAKQEADSLARSLGPRHPNLIAAQTRAASLRAEINGEAGRIVNAAKVDYDQARGLYNSLTKQAAELKGDLYSDNQSKVRLRELEREAASKASIYESYLNRAKEITERRQLDTSNVRVISPAVAPLGRAWPPRGVVMAGFGGMAGLVLGLGAALAIGYIRHRPTRRAI